MRTLEICELGYVSGGLSDDSGDGNPQNDGNSAFYDYPMENFDLSMVKHGGFGDGDSFTFHFNTTTGQGLESLNFHFVSGNFTSDNKYSFNSHTFSQIDTLSIGNGWSAGIEWSRNNSTGDVQAGVTLKRKTG